MKIRVITNAKKTSVEQRGDCFVVRVTAPPVDNKANKMVLKVLSKFLGKKNLVIVKGEKSRDKIVVAKE
jgi:uncharacterized protein (TIGR00251 family)